jgi:hypothetical protein
MEGTKEDMWETTLRGLKKNDVEAGDCSKIK